MMKKLIDISSKNEKYVVGLMSGTSVDAVDAVLVKLKNSGTETEIDLIGFIEYPMPSDIRELILRNSVNETSSVEEICKLNFIIPQIYFDSIKELCKQTGFELNKLDLIGSHGQTIQHHPEKKIYSGYKTASTLQIGDPAVLAKLTGIVTVGDFRTGDIALGGEGAPLVPYFDFIVFRSNEVNRALLNLGGIANITLLKKNSSMEDVIAFDTGPANMLLDMAAKIFLNKNLDLNGEIASSGKFNENLFNALLVRDQFIEAEPPKSTGREYYGESFIKSLFEEFSDVKAEDWLNTLSHFTVYGVYRNYEKYLSKECTIDELIISGGGAKNLFLLKLFKEKFEGVDVKIIEEFGLSGDAKEAICFAVLANETLAGNPTNIIGATGASRNTILGKICLP